VFAAEDSKFRRVEILAREWGGLLAGAVFRIPAHPVVSVFCRLSPKQQKYQNFPYKKAVREWLR